MFYMKKV